MRSVTCPDCGAQVELPTVSVGDESVTVNCQNCLWQDLDSIYKTRRGLEIWSGGGGVAEMACWTCVGPGAGLQAAINSMPGGGNIMLQPGVYSGDITMTYGNTNILGSGWNTILSGSLLIPSAFNSVQDLTVRATGKTYGVKLYNASGGGVPRTTLKRLWMGGTTVGAHDGPDKGLWIDGAILTRAEQCTMSFNNDHGLYVNTTDSNWPSTTNTFQHCSFNFNNEGGVSGYGVQLETGFDGVSGMSQHTFHGGNIESNMTNDFKADSNTGLVLSSVDFETVKTLSNIIDISGSQPVLIENCNFNLEGGTVPRAFLLTNCATAVVRGCRASGSTWSTNAIGVFSEGCFDCQSYNNVWGPARAGAFVNNRGWNRSDVV